MYVQFLNNSDKIILGLVTDKHKIVILTLNKKII